MNAAQLARVYGYVIDQCLDGYLFDADFLAREWDTTEDELNVLGVRSVPSHVRNLCIGAACKKKFGSEVLAGIPGFKSFSRTTILCDCREFSQSCWCNEQSWILDIDPHLHPHGLLIPEVDQRGRAVGIRVLRNHKDPKGFILKSRKEFSV